MRKIYRIYDPENRPKDTAIEVEEELNEDEKGPYVLKSKVVKAINDM